MSFASGLNVSSVVPSVFKRAIQFLVGPPIVVKLPLTRILPSGCSAMERILLFAFGSNTASAVPSAFSRAT